ncbi:hypothetical protein I302_101616 [Kwoniella bestiolae CBS 10118]|uniref:Uncharacterized protein n=1 Tax=Kwoniella bestiolae CBS 10118 TaxID=1296100 RepID=A0A1B9GCR0_9TREE|nr:hypothetical protein I302_00297 [Kwoniella bestiolae CBS 10118]OCF28808.1 hypothetical protein I302_00297 [Kwoniella bestiolae CBS 10118]
MSSNVPLTRRRPKPSTAHYPELPPPIPSPPSRQGHTTSRRPSVVASTIHEILQDTPSPLRELERGWKETRRKRLGIVSLADENSPRDDTITQVGYDRLRGNNPYDAGETNFHRETFTGKEPGGGVMERPSGNEYRRNRNTVNVRFITSSSSALLTPPDTPPASPKVPDNSIPNRKKDQQASSRAKGNIPTRPRQHSIISSSCPPVPPQPVTIPQPRKHTIKPILSHPLPPTSRPVRIQKNKRDTIYIPSQPSRYEVVLDVVGGQTIRVGRGGRTVEFISGSGGRKGKRRVLDIEEVEKWSNEDKRDWENFNGVVEGFKRIIPRIKIFHPLGHLSITCSSPPDISFSFQKTMESSNINTPSKSTDSSSRESPGFKDMRTRARVRVVYSRSIRELKIDLVCANSLNREKLRTRRVIHIARQFDGNFAVDGKRGEDMTLQDIIHRLGVAGEPGDWREEEKEGVRRLWDLKNEWLRWDDR